MARYKSNQQWTGDTRLLAVSAVNASRLPALPWARVHVLYRFHYPRRTMADLDNLVGSMKPCLDGIVGVVVTSDDAQHVHRLSAAVELDRTRPPGVTMVISPCDCVAQDGAHS